MKGIHGKKVLVTGASQGIGQAIAVRFGQEGADVAVNYLSSIDEARQTEDLIRQEGIGADVRVVLLQGDVSQEADADRLVQETVDELGGLDILVNNAGIQIPGAAHQIEVDTFDKVLAVNLRGAYLCARRAIQHFLEAGQAGIILNVSSVHEIIPRPQYIGYSVSKGGMQNLTRTLALEYAGRDIRVNAIGPGATATPINSAWIDDPEKRADVERHIPMGRAGTSAEMAAVAAFLCSDEAAYITGQTLFVDGGLTLYPDFREPWSGQG